MLVLTVRLKVVVYAHLIIRPPETRTKKERETMKRMLAVSLLALCAVMGFAGESDYNGFLWVTNPQGEGAKGQDIIGSLRLGVGFGYCFRGEGLFNPGLEFRCSTFPLVMMLKEPIFMMEVGFRAFNSIVLGPIDLQPLGGATFYFSGYKGKKDHAIRMELGARAIIGKFGFEYAAILPGDDVELLLGYEKPVTTLGAELAHRFCISIHSRVSSSPK